MYYKVLDDVKNITVQSLYSFIRLVKLYFLNIVLPYLYLLKEYFSFSCAAQTLIYL